MSYRPNRAQQLTFEDNLNHLTDRERRFLDKSWAKIFGDDLFPLIDEDMFSVLYSEKDSRPNTPVNILVGASIIKEMMGYSYDEMYTSLMFDIRLQYALHTTSYEEQPLSDKSLERFLKRVADYKEKTEIDLIHDCIVGLSKSIAKIMRISGKCFRMDSMMLDALITNLSRPELIYTCLSNLVKELNKTNIELPEELIHYTQPNDFNAVIYHDKKTSKEKMEVLLKDVDTVYEICSKHKYEKTAAYRLFDRCMNEQTIVEDGVRRLRTKKEGINSSMLQNPSDPDATYREKAGKGHKGYVANFEESVGTNGSVITDYQFEQNTYSDEQFLKDNLENKEVQEDGTILTTDAAYISEENKQLAESKNITLIATNLTGKETPDIMGDFEFNEEGTQITKCPAGHEPIKSTYYEKTGTCRAVFDKKCCENCPHKEECKAKFGKKNAAVTTSIKSKNRALTQRQRKTKEFKYYSRFRNGVETVPSMMRRLFGADNLPRGKKRGSLVFGFKIGAFNMGKLMRFRMGMGKYAQNPIIV